MSRKLPTIVLLYIMFMCVCVYEWAWSVVLYRPDPLMFLQHYPTQLLVLHAHGLLLAFTDYSFCACFLATIGTERELCSLISFECVEKGGAWMPDNISQQVPVVTFLV